MTDIQEGDLLFSFGELWRVIKYDGDGGYYRTRLLKRIKHTKAMDFLCLRSGNEPLLMLEVKDYGRGVQDTEKYRGVLVAVAEKVRDTLAGVIGGSCKADIPERNGFRDSYAKLSSPPRVILFFRDLATPKRQQRQESQAKRSTLLKLLKTNLRWLTSDVAVVGLDDYSNFIRDLTVRKAPEK